MTLATSPKAQWAVMPDGSYRLCGATVANLPAGAYTCYDTGFGLSFQRRELHVDQLIECPSSLAAQMLDEIERFWGLEERFRRYGFLQRRGYLLHGRPGSGKTSVIHQVIVRAVAAGHVAFFCETPDFVECLQAFRSVEPTRPMLCVFEDIDVLASHNDTGLLQWLDGYCQVDKVVNIATTNFPEELDRRIVSRPRRFDRVLRIDAPDSQLRDAYLAAKVPDLSPAEREQWVAVSSDLSFAALTELVISVRCLGNDLVATAQMLRKIESEAPKDESRSWPQKRRESRKHPRYEDDVPF